MQGLISIFFEIHANPSHRVLGTWSRPVETGLHGPSGSHAGASLMGMGMDQGPTRLPGRGRPDAFGTRGMAGSTLAANFKTWVEASLLTSAGASRAQGFTPLGTAALVPHPETRERLPHRALAPLRKGGIEPAGG
jgi:hypothetical protein